MQCETDENAHFVTTNAHAHEQSRNQVRGERSGGDGVRPSRGEHSHQ